MKSFLLFILALGFLFTTSPSIAETRNAAVSPVNQSAMKLADLFSIENLAGPLDANVTYCTCHGINSCTISCLAPKAAACNKSSNNYCGCHCQ